MTPLALAATCCFLLRDFLGIERRAAIFVDAGPECNAGDAEVIVSWDLEGREDR